MTHDSDLYGTRPNKKPRVALSSSSALDFTAKLTSAIAESAQAPEASRPRRSKAIGLKKQQQALENSERSKLKLKEILQTHEEAKLLDKSRKRLEEKARIYDAMKRGDYVKQGKPEESLVDFDRKWAEEREKNPDAQDDSDSDSDSSFAESGDDEMVEYVDEFGRSRHISRAEKKKIDRRELRKTFDSKELDPSGSPRKEKNLIYGDFIQTMAFVPQDIKVMEELAKKRDRSATPPPPTHYDADWEIRDKGVGFYKFSKDEEERKQEMENLKTERKETEDKRRALEEKKESRKRDIAARRQAIESRRAKKKADDFLASLSPSIG
ncbi:Coiled-coil domain-containing protein 174 [Ceratocystis lukuohia]|uniref:Coiled-coil domain-containing protein 174 n=1 Tax=Ceratocystis lukuohia TaxID=2019550 RepID=A0ABR4MIW1_9PEZI